MKKDKVITKQQYKQLVKILLKLSRYDLYRLSNISRQQFGRKTNTINSIFKQGKCKYSDLKKDAMNQLVRYGVSNPVDLKLKDGTYLIVSDSHGKHTNRGMFRLFNVLNSYFNFKNIIHIGHAVDDDNDVSYLWKQFDNLIVIARDQERQQIEQKKQQYGYTVINGSVYINGLRIVNQQVVRDYSKTSINLMDSYLYQSDCIFSGHKHQLVNKGVYDRSLTYCCPGCVCEPHITTTVKQIDFKGGGQIKQTYPSSYASYRSRKHLLNYWEQGVVIVEACNGVYSIHPIRIKKINNQHITSFNDKIFTQSSIQKPDNKIFFHSDLHVPNVDCFALQNQHAFVKDYQPNYYVNLGDMLNCKSLNHHDMDRGNYIDYQLFDQFSEYCRVMKWIDKWGVFEKHIVFGNHERFMNDYASKYPQFKKMFQCIYNSPIEQFGYIKHDLKTYFKIGGVKFLHGDLKIYGQNGSYLDKISKTFGDNTIVGHLHVNEIKRGCYIVGLTGKYDQQYNDLCGSRWQQGFGFTNQYKGCDFTQLISIDSEYGYILDGKQYCSKNKVGLQNVNVKMIVE